MKTAESPKPPAPAAPLPDAAQLDNLLASLLILVEQEANVLRHGSTEGLASIQERIAILVGAVAPLAEKVKAKAPLSAAARAKLDRIKELQRTSSESAREHLDRLRSRLDQISGSQNRLKSMRPIYGRTTSSSSGLELKG